MDKLESGLTIGGYRIEARIGRGGMGVVYRATHIALERQVALKVIAEELAEDEGFRERFRREPKLAASIDHPNVIPVFDAGEVSDQLFVAMRYVEGSDLRSLIADQGRLEPERAVRIVAQVAEGLDAAHELGLVHRDVKPANVLIEDRNGREHVYLTDFGLTKGGEGSTALTKTGQWVGTPDYVAPEQIHGGTLDRRTDIYALGAVLYHALSGHPPYGRETEVAKIYAHLSRPPPELPDDIDVSPELKATIRCAMAKEAAERYSTAGELGRQALAALGSKRAEPPSAIVSPTVPAEAPEETAGPPAEAPFVDDDTALGQTAALPDDTALAGAGVGAARNGSAVGPGATVAADTAEFNSGTAVGPPPQAAPGRLRPLLGDRRIVGLLAVLATIAFAAAGFLIGSSGGDDTVDESSFTSEAGDGTLAVRFPAGWENAGEAVPVPGIMFNRRINLTPAGQDEGVGLAAGQVDATGPKLLPERFLRLLGDQPPSGEPVKLDRTEALRYSNLQPRGFDGRLTVFTVPTDAGVATVACAGRNGTPPSVTDECEQIATTLRLVNAQPYPIGPDKGYASVLNRTLDDLSEARAEKLKLARDASKPAAQAAALHGLATSYSDAAGRLREVRVSPAAQPANSAIADALAAGEAAYAGMSEAASSNDEGGYNAARARAGRADAELERSLDRLAPLGYEVG